jgi:hypothetical protein
MTISGEASPFDLVKQSHLDASCELRVITGGSGYGLAKTVHTYRLENSHS